MSTTNKTQKIKGGKKIRARKRKQWYVVHTYSGYENKVKNNILKRLKSFGLEDQVEEILVPTQPKIEFQGGEKKKVDERIFPGYILILMSLDDTLWSIIRKTPGVTGFVGRGIQPTPLTVAEIQNIKEVMEQKTPTFKTRFTVGEAIKISDGPFTDFIGKVEKINDEQGTMVVLISIFGRETPVEIEFNQAAKME